jgi:hypothetical protein
MNKMKKIYILIPLFILCLLTYFPVVKAKFIKRNHYTFAITTKALTPESTAFSYTGNVQQFKTTKEGYYIFQVWGANGGNSSNGYAGGIGDSFTCMGYFTEDQIFQIAIGGIGKNGSGSSGGAGGYNGGGTGGSGGWFGLNSGGGGGGATSIFLNDTSLNNRILVAGGGGGGAAGGNGADTKGGSVSVDSFTEINQEQYKGYFRAGLAGIGDGNIADGNFSGGGGSIVGGQAHYTAAGDLSSGANGTEGLGGNAGNWAGGGGGGLYAGAGGSSTNAISGGGGAGSSYYNEALANALSQTIIDRLPTNHDFPDQPYQTGNGFAIITYVGKVLPD